MGTLYWEYPTPRVPSTVLEVPSGRPPPGPLTYPQWRCSSDPAHIPVFPILAILLSSVSSIRVFPILDNPVFLLMENFVFPLLDNPSNDVCCFVHPILITKSEIHYFWWVGASPGRALFVHIHIYILHAPRRRPALLNQYSILLCI